MPKSHHEWWLESPRPASPLTPRWLAKDWPAKINQNGANAALHEVVLLPWHLTAQGQVLDNVVTVLVDWNADQRPGIQLRITRTVGVQLQTHH